MDNLKIIVADDQYIVRRGTSSLLRSVFENVEIIEAQDFAEIIPLLTESKSDAIILDINIPGGNSTEMIKKIRQVDAKIFILMFSAYEESDYAWRYIQAGANGFLSKNTCEKEIIGALGTLLRTGKYISPNVKEKILDNLLQNIPMNPLKILSAREAEVAELLIMGVGVLEIANQLHVQASTISTYKNRVFEKLKINNLAELIEIFKVYRD